MKDVTEIFRKAADEHDTYYYETVRYALESDMIRGKMFDRNKYNV